ncbi:MAG: hypothetical protein KDA55_10050 [Planctomycetales bacterium]|nr:hypothetical protein [Planctomycetales bacterium]MCA9162229.1 hypothetical protein [Planctomycetales bacterium]MCA9203509.1 hypothetical protein [Planctomycetales bacterium]MCA9208687.1 hypothetical protein [Planctomycetales bacterium]
MEPLISIVLDQNQRRYSPGELLTCEYQVDAIEADEIQAVEASVMWHTEGKGDEDFSVHWFERRLPHNGEADLRPLHRIKTRLPNSPLSYDGQIVKVRWQVRVRVFLRGGKDFHSDKAFELGQVDGFQ